MKIGCVVLHYRFWPGVRATLDALLTQTRPPDMVVVVDNHSNDGSLPELRRAYPDLEVIEAESNRAYAAGMNLGMETVLTRGVDAILLLTDECRLSPDALGTLVARLEAAPGLGAVGPVLGYLSQPEKVFSAGGRVELRGWDTRHLREPELVSEWTGRPPHAVEWLDGAALLLRSQAVRAIGRLDEGYIKYFEETDYMFRLRAAGWSVECVPQAVAWQEPSGKPPYLWTHSRLRFLARRAPTRVLLGEIARMARSLLRNRLRPRPQSVRAEDRERRRALLHFVTSPLNRLTTLDGHIRDELERRNV